MRVWDNDSTIYSYSKYELRVRETLEKLLDDCNIKHTQISLGDWIPRTSNVLATITYGVTLLYDYMANDIIGYVCSVCGELILSSEPVGVCFNCRRSFCTEYPNIIINEVRQDNEK